MGSPESQIKIYVVLPLFPREAFNTFRELSQFTSPEHHNKPVSHTIQLRGRTTNTLLMPSTLNGGGDATHANGNGIATKQFSSKKIPHLPARTKESKHPGAPLTLPPGFSEEKYDDFIATARQIVEEQNVTVITDAAQLVHEHYTDPSKVHDMHNVVEKTYFVASAVLCPRDVKDVQEIMRLCNQFEMPVWPFSIGRK